MRLDIGAFELPDRGIGTLILTSTQGGTLANAVYLPQEGQPTKMLNTKARLRGAVAVANGGNASIQAGGKAVLTSQTAGVIASKYTLLDAGTLPVTLTVNGAPVDCARHHAAGRRGLHLAGVEQCGGCADQPDRR